MGLSFLPRFYVSQRHDGDTPRAFKTTRSLSLRGGLGLVVVLVATMSSLPQRAPYRCRSLPTFQLALICVVVRRAKLRNHYSEISL